jgi:succinate dehydrogenase/fumarate reductase flavoprotein subunit
LERKESRWGGSHMRSDYPEQDDVNWLKHVILKQGDNEHGIKVETSPVLGMDD